MTLRTFGRSDQQLRAHAELDVWMVRRVLAGWLPRAIATASGDAISIRTIYRWRRDLVGIEEVRVGEHVATFVLRRDAGPTRITPWVRRPASVTQARAMGGVRCGAWMPVARQQCARFGGHRSQHNSRAYLDDVARVERGRRAKVKRTNQEGTWPEA